MRMSKTVIRSANTNLKGIADIIDVRIKIEKKDFDWPEGWSTLAG